jgi:glutamate racemase
VTQIEAGELESQRTRTILEEALSPMLSQGIDTVVLGCTHYPFVMPLIQEITGPDMRVIDPAPAVARQVSRVLQVQGIANPGTQPGTVRFLTTGDPQKMEALLAKLVGEGVSAESIALW